MLGPPGVTSELWRLKAEAVAWPPAGRYSAAQVRPVTGRSGGGQPLAPAPLECLARLPSGATDAIDPAPLTLPERLPAAEASGMN